MTFFDLPLDTTCRHPEHKPPTGLYIPPGKGYKHVCPTCGVEQLLLGDRFTLQPREDST